MPYCLGLHLRLIKWGNDIASFTYGVSPFVDKHDEAVQCMKLSTKPVKSRHIRCHALKPDDNLPELITTFKKSNVEAVVLINTLDEHFISLHFKEGMCFSFIIMD